MYSKNRSDSDFAAKVVDFTFVDTAKGCSQAFAQAVKTRIGVGQYGLYSDALRLEAADQKIVWTTGVSGPYVADYTINAINAETYRIIFKWLTSSEPAEDSVMTLHLVKEGDYYRINAIDYGK